MRGLSVAAPAFGQGGTASTISGAVVDSGGGVVPGADVVVRHNATGITTSVVSNGQGAFSIPGLAVGSYTVTVSLSGFKTFIVNDVVLTSGAGASVRAVLDVGGVTEQVTVVSSSEIVQTQAPTISTTVNTNQITQLPITSRSAMDFVNMLPGVSTPNGNRQATINGLPRRTINITLDGVNIQDNTLRSTDGFFAIVSPRLDAVEEVTVTTAAQGAADAGQGAVQVKFVTRMGTNAFDGSGYYYYRNDALNANTWFNIRDGVAKPALRQNQEGFRVGGPIMKNKAFFFVNYEEFHQPSETTRTRTILNTAAQAGNFSYSVNGTSRTVNVLDLAARSGQLATLDPTTSKILQEIRSAVSGGSLQTLDDNLERFRFNVPVQSINRYPTFRLDYNLNDAHRAWFAYNYQRITGFPDTLNNRDPSFPGFPVAAGQYSERLAWSSSLRSTLSSNLVNEARLAYSGAPVQFFPELNVGMFNGSSVNQQGFSLRFPTVNTQLTNPAPNPGPSSRNANSLLVEDTVTWLKGLHSISLGGSFTQYDIWVNNVTQVPSVFFGIVTSDPASSLFTAGNFPGASAANITAASNLYALLTGRIMAINADARLNDAGKYEYVGNGRQAGRLRETGMYVQDAWRFRPNATLTAGVRYDIQLPFYPLNSLYSFATIDDLCGVSGAASDHFCNVFQPGVQPGVQPTFKQYTSGTYAYRVDKNNIAPNVGVAWTPSQKDGLLGALMGSELVVRGGYTRSYSRPGLNDFTSVFGGMPGITIDTNRNESNGNLGATPLLLRETSRLGAPSFPSSPTYPLTGLVTDAVRVFDPRIQVPSADSWSAGIQRSLGKDMAVEVRYVGTRGRDQWRFNSNGNNGVIVGTATTATTEVGSLNYNEFNIFENHFIDEFKRAQANLQANIAAGRGATFAYTGAPGTAPLPTFLAFFNGQPASQAANTSAYSGSNWSNSTFLNFLAIRNPNPFGFATASANGLMGTAAFRANAAAAGLPTNFFVANPDLLGGAFLTANVGATKYNSLQLELKRRSAQGLQFQTSYVFGHGYLLDGDVSHQFKANVVYDLPFGHNRRWGANAGGVVEHLIGGWQLGLATRLQSGRLIDIGNVRLVGMTVKDVEKMFNLRIDGAGRKVWMLPDDVIQQTIAAFSVSPTSPTGYAGNPPSGRYFAPANGPDCIEVDSNADYGACASRSVVVTGPIYRQTDLRIAKRTRIGASVNLEFALEALNVFNQVNFQPVGIGGGTTTFGTNINNYEITMLNGTNTSRQMQIVSRINW